MLVVQFRALSLNFEASGRPSEIPVNFVHLRPHAATVVSESVCLVLSLYVSHIFISALLSQIARHITIVLFEIGT